MAVDMDSYTRLVRELLKKERFEQAEQTLLDALEEVEQTDAVYRMLGVLYSMSGKVLDGMKILGDGVRRHPDDAVLALMLGTLLINQQRHREAIPVLERVLELEPTNEVAALEITGAYYAVQRWPKVIWAAELALELGARSEPLLAALAYAYSQQDELERSIEILEQALRLSPDSPHQVDLRVTLVPIAVRAGRLQEAADALSYIAVHTVDPSLRAEAQSYLSQVQQAQSGLRRSSSA